MIELFRIAVKEVFQDNFGLQTAECDTLPEHEGFTAVIPFEEDSRHYEASIWVDPPLIENLSRILLEDEDPDEQTREDLTSELANFIVGHAKMLASDRAMPCSISTPRFTGLKKVDREGESLAFRIGDACLVMSIGEPRG